MRYLAPIPLQFVDESGVPCSGGTVSVHYAGNNTLALIYENSYNDELVDNPVVLDSFGMWKAYVDAGVSLDYIVKDREGNVVASYLGVVASGGDGGGTGDVTKAYVDENDNEIRASVDNLAADVADEVGRAEAAEKAAKTEVVGGENVSVEETIAPDGHSIFSVSSDGAPQEQADWNQQDQSEPDYIKNKPTKLSKFTDDITKQSLVESGVGIDKPVSSAAVNAGLSEKADKVSNAVQGHFAGLDASGNLTDSGAKASDFATAAQGRKADTALQEHQDISGKANKSEMAITDVSGDATKKTIQLKDGLSQVVVVDHQDISGKAEKNEMAINEVAGDATKKNIQLKSGLDQDVVVAHQDISGKADKVSGATSGNFAALDASGNLTDSGKNATDFKTKQTAVTDPSADGTGLSFIDSVSQDTNGVITPHKKTVQDGTTSQKGVVQLEDSFASTSTTTAATPNAVKAAYDLAATAVQGVKVNGTELSKDGNNVVDVPVPAASAATPAMDGTASAGSSTQWARGDHRHPTDDSREAVANKKQSIDPTSTTEYGSSKAVAEFVNSSVATNTANFLGTIAESSLGLDYTATNAQIELALNVHSWESTPTNNDYCFVSVNNPQTTDVDEYRRFKFNDKTNLWGYEYTLNNSSFTQAQWDAINSGLTSSDRTAYNAAVTLLNSHVGNGDIHVTASDKTHWNSHIANTSNPHNVTAEQVGAEPAFSVLPISKGGTGGTAQKEAAYNIFSNIVNTDETISDTSVWIQGVGSPSAKLGPFYRNKISRVWAYIQGKISSVLGLTASSYGGNAATASAAASGSALETAINAKQDTISDLATIRSGAAAGATAVQPSTMNSALALKEDAANKSQTLDPASTTEFPSSAATASFVNSSVATNTATFRGNFKLTDLGLDYTATNAQIELALNVHSWPVGVVPTNNDYVYVEIENPQTTGIDDVVERFKFNGTDWHYEYTLNNSSFTAAEKAAIDSGIDAAKVAIYDAHVANGDIHVTAAEKATWNAKQDAISDLSTIRSGAAAGATAVQPSEMTSALAGKQDVINDLSTIRSGAAKGATSVQPADLAPYAVASDVETALAGKQDVISDLSDIRSGAAAGATALQPSGDGSNLSVTPDGTSTGYDLGSSTTLKAFAQKFKNLVGALKALAFKDTVGTSDIDDDAITAAKVKDNETLPVSISGNAASASSVAWSNVSGKPTVDQSYNATSTNPQSGTAVAQAVSGKLGTTGDASNTTSTFTKASGDTSSMTSGGKLSAFFTAISSFFASLKALAFKDKVSDSDISGTISDSHVASASTWNGKYTKPGTGIPKSDLASAVQTSLGKADTALQSHQDISGKLDKTGDASNTTSTFTKASGDTSSMTSGSKLSALFTAISNFFASLGTAAFKDVTNSYSSTGTDPVSGTAVNVAIAALDVSSVGGSGKYIQSISETDGKISASAANMPTSLPASDVYSWAKAATKPSYTAGEVGAASASHTHNYAGSASAGGSAYSADKVNISGYWTKTDNNAPLGLRVYKAYNNGWPTTYGNVISIGGGASGDSQLVLGWSGSTGGIASIYYRNRRDSASNTWSDWRQLAFTSDKVATAGTADSAAQVSATGAQKAVAVSVNGISHMNGSKSTVIDGGQVSTDTLSAGTAVNSDGFWAKTSMLVYGGDTPGSPTGNYVLISPNGIRCNGEAAFTGNLVGNASTASGVKDYGDTSKTIEIGYAGQSLTSASYLAAYAVVNGHYYIKNISTSDVTVGRATADGSGNNIVNTYQKKVMISACARGYSPTIAAGSTASVGNRPNNQLGIALLYPLSGTSYIEVSFNLSFTYPSAGGYGTYAVILKAGNSSSSMDQIGSVIKSTYQSGSSNYAEHVTVEGTVSSSPSYLVLEITNGYGSSVTFNLSTILIRITQNVTAAAQAT